jgi:hypothetical protein
LPVWVMNECATGCGHFGSSTHCDSGRLGAPSHAGPLREAFGHAPLVLSQEHVAELLTTRQVSPPTA